MEVAKKIPPRHFVLSIPKMLRNYFLYDRSTLLKEFGGKTIYVGGLATDYCMR
jgi:hypothetical protein